jgi:hypothetical protein
VSLAAALALSLAAAASAAPPSRAPEKGCVWKRLDAPELGVSLYHQKCDFGFRTADHSASAKTGSVYEVLRDTATGRESKEPVISMIPVKAGETPEAAIRREVFPSMKGLERNRCVVVRKNVAALDSAGKAAYTIVPNAAYAAELAKQFRDEVPPPPCGARGESADGQSYFEFHPRESSRRIAFVDLGQDEPLFDERSLRFLP